MFHYRVFVLVLASISFFGCFGSYQGIEENKPKADAIAVFLERNSMYDTEFEQYQLKASSLFYECGKIRNHRFFPVAQDVLTVEDKKAGEFFEKAERLRLYLTRKRPALDKPGTLKGFSDPGKAVVAVLKDSSPQEVHTSVAQLAKANDAFALGLQDLVSSLRRYVRKNRGDDALCGNEHFYGIK